MGVKEIDQIVQKQKWPCADILHSAGYKMRFIGYWEQCWLYSLTAAGGKDLRYLSFTHLGSGIVVYIFWCTYTQDMHVNTFFAIIYPIKILKGCDKDTHTHSMPTLLGPPSSCQGFSWKKKKKKIMLTPLLNSCQTAESYSFTPNTF